MHEKKVKAPSVVESELTPTYVSREMTGSIPT